MEVVPNWKVLAGVRWDRFEGNYVNPTSATFPVASPLRLALEQPVRRALAAERHVHRLRVVRHVLQHLGRALQLRPARVERAAGEEPQHRDRREAGDVRRQDVEPGRGVPDDQVQRAQPRLARGPADRRLHPVGRAACHAASSSTSRVGSRRAGRCSCRTPGFRIAKIDEAAYGITPGGERVGDRPSMTPKHSGSLFTTYQLVREDPCRRRHQRAQLADADPQSARDRRARLHDLRFVRRVRLFAAGHLQAERQQRDEQALRGFALHRPLHPRPAAHDLRVH